MWLVVHSMEDSDEDSTGAAEVEETGAAEVIVMGTEVEGTGTAEVTVTGTEDSEAVEVTGQTVVPMVIVSVVTVVE